MEELKRERERETLAERVIFQEERIFDDDSDQNLKKYQRT